MADRQIVHTTCLRSRDAVLNDDGEYVFNLKPANPGAKPMKLMLNSLEFPVVQYTIEKSWSRLYFNEGITLVSDSCEVSRSVRGKEAHLFTLPLSSLRCSVELHPAGVRVNCSEPHGLWCGGQYMAKAIVKAFGIDSLTLFCTFGRIKLSKVDLTYVDPHTFTAPPDVIQPVQSMAHGDTRALLHNGNITSPSALFRLFRSYAKACNLPVTLEYNPANNTVVPVTVGATDSTHVSGSFVKWIGFAAGIPASNGHTTVLRQPWQYVELTAGWYVPSHRPMACGAPSKLPVEFDAQMNRLAFLPMKPTSPFPTGHILVFVDPGGQTCVAPIMTGKYNVLDFCTHVTAAMTDATTDYSMSLTYDVRTERFTFSCADETGPCPFALRFDHAYCSIEASRFGYMENVPYSGMDSYISDPVHIPTVINHYSVSEHSPSKKMFVTRTELPAVTGFVYDYNAALNVVTLITHCGGLPCAHGIQPGQIVRLISMSKPMEIMLPTDGSWQAVEVPPCNTTVYGIVQEPSQKDSRSCIFLVISCCGGSSFTSNSVVGVSHSPMPFNLCFETLPMSIKAPMMGFPVGATQWGIDGCVLTHDKFRPGPFLAPNVYYMEHPDYLLLNLSCNTRPSTQISHTDGDRVKHVFTKMVMFPMHREGGGFSKDVMLLSGETPNIVKISVVNPTGEPYHMHGAEFSLSLTVIYA